MEVRKQKAVSVKHTVAGYESWKRQMVIKRRVRRDFKAEH
jgi:hypothetical protein